MEDARVESCGVSQVGVGGDLARDELRTGSRAGCIGAKVAGRGRCWSHRYAGLSRSSGIQRDEVASVEEISGLDDELGIDAVLDGNKGAGVAEHRPGIR